VQYSIYTYDYSAMGFKMSSLDSDSLTEIRSPQLAAVVFDHDIDVDKVLRETIAVLRHRGFRVGGAVQVIGNRWTACRRVMAVEDLLTGETLKISQDLGPEAQSCVLDPAALTEASAMLRLAMSNHVDMVVGNRFGEQEINGRGLRAEFADAAMGGFVVLTAVQSRHVNGWIAFGGGYAVALEPSAQTVTDWAFNAVTSRPSVRRHATPSPKIAVSPP
jgi:hypothetical protein